MKVLSRINKVVAGGDVVGGDKIINNNLPSPRQLDLLSDNFKKELANNITTAIVIDELHHYRNQKSEVRNLSQKLSEAGFDYLLEEGEYLKEVVAKLIIKYQHYKSAQKIITFLLADVESIFNTKIKPKLNSVDSEAQLRNIFREHLEKEIQEKLGDNVLEIFNRQINGMVFFLTGNCHLEWK